MNVVGLWWALSPPDQAKLPGHAQVDNQHAAVVRNDGQLLTATRQLSDGGGLKQVARGTARIGRRPDVAAEQPGSSDRAAKERRQAAADRLDFRKFRHGGV